MKMQKVLTTQIWIQTWILKKNLQTSYSTQPLSCKCGISGKLLPVSNFHYLCLSGLGMHSICLVILGFGTIFAVNLKIRSIYRVLFLLL